MRGAVVSEYGFALGFVVFSTLLSGVIYLLSFLLVPKVYDVEKLSAYECGFDPFLDTRGMFDVRFYLVSILFIVFDLEVTFLFPWAVSLRELSSFSIFSMLAFLFILTVGFVYEWSKGALEWE